MTDDQKARQLMDDLLIVLEVFSKANWPDTKAGNAAYNLATNMSLIRKRMLNQDKNA